jgi:uncharacterized protein (DUF58 family)
MMLPPRFSSQFLRQLELFKVVSRRNFLGSRQGGHVSLKRGHGIEFSDYRKYELGDSPRHIDWGLYARSDRMYVKTFQEETNLPVLLILDTSNSMRVPEETGKWEYARDIVLALSYMALMAQEDVSIAALGAFIKRGYYGGRAIYRIASDLEKVTVGEPQGFSKEFLKAAAQTRFPGVAIVISDFLTPLEEIRTQLNSLRAKNLDVTAVQVLSSFDRDPTALGDWATVEDSETGEIATLAFHPDGADTYSSLLVQHTEALSQFCYQSQIKFVQASTEEEMMNLFSEKLRNIGLLR